MNEIYSINHVIAAACFGAATGILFAVLIYSLIISKYQKLAEDLSLELDELLRINYP